MRWSDVPRVRVLVGGAFGCVGETLGMGAEVGGGSEAGRVAGLRSASEMAGRLGCNAVVVVLVSIVVSIPACHAGDRGSIPRRGDIPSFLARRAALGPLAIFACLAPRLNARTVVFCPKSRARAAHCQEDPHASRPSGP